MATADDSQSAKDVAFYQAMVQAWINTRMEKDKTLLSLAAAAIGLLVTLLTTTGPTSVCQWWLYLAAGFSFFCTIALGIWIFARNTAHLEDVVNKGVRGNDTVLIRLDVLLLLSFVLGVLLTGSIALSSGWAKIH
jgi:hypothetical protein